MKKGTCKRFMAMAMSLVTALGTGFGGGVNMVYAANSFKAGDTVQIKYLHNNKTYKKSAVDARWNDKILGTKMPGYIDEDSNAMYSAYWIFGLTSLFLAPLPIIPLSPRSSSDGAYLSIR